MPVQGASGEAQLLVLLQHIAADDDLELQQHIQMDQPARAQHDHGGHGSVQSHFPITAVACRDRWQHHATGERFSTALGSQMPEYIEQQHLGDPAAGGKGCAAPGVFWHVEQQSVAGAASESEQEHNSGYQVRHLHTP